MKKYSEPIDELIKFYEKQKLNMDFSFFNAVDFGKIIDYYIAHDKPDKALQAGIDANQEIPYHSDLILRLAKSLSNLRKFEEALELLEKATLVDPNNPDIHFWLGKIYDEIAESDMALEHFDLALENCTSGKDEIYLGKALVYIHDDKYEDARVSIRKSLKINPYNIDAVYELINSCVSEDDKTGTIAFYEKIIDKNPYDHKIWNNLGIMLDSFMLHEKAAEVFELSTSIDDHDPETFYLLGNAYLNYESYLKASNAFKKSINLGKKEYTVWSQLGLAYTFLENFEDARNCFKVCVEDEPGFSEGWFGLGIVCENLGDNKTAIHYINKAITLNPSNEKFYYELAFCYAAVSNLDEAEKSYKQAVELNPFFVDGWLDYSLFLYEQEKTSEAINSLQEAITFNPDDAGLYYIISGILYDKGLNNRGKFYLEKGLKIDPGASDILFEIFPYLHSNDAIVEMINNNLLDK